MKRVTLLGSDPRELPADWLSSAACEIFIIRRWAQERAAEVPWVERLLPEIPSHVWLASSGTLSTAGKSKWLAVSKQALLASAQAVNQHLNIQPKDRWGLTLPLAHVGGLGIIVRAHLMQQEVKVLIKDKWSAELVAQEAWEGEWLSLVPTQVHDLVVGKLRPPKMLKGVIVGGDRLSPDLFQAAAELGWPLLPSYGLTECCSQVATTLPGTKDFKLLPHIQAKTDSEDRLWLQSPALFSGEAIIENGEVSYQERALGWWPTQDRAEIHKETLTVLGRMDGVVKVRGEKVEIAQLENELEKKWQTRLIVVPIQDDRDGVALWLVSEKPLELSDINAQLLPHQKLKGIRHLAHLPRTALGKIRRAEIGVWLKDNLT